MATFSLSCVQMAGRSLAWMVMLMAAVLATKSVEGQTYKVLYIFTGGTDGGGPSNQLARIGTNLYGTAAGGASGDGAVFKQTANGMERKLWFILSRAKMGATLLDCCVMRREISTALPNSEGRPRARESSQHF